MRANWFCLQSPGTQPSSLLRGGLAAAFVAASMTASAETTISGYLGDSWTRSSDLRVSQSATDSDATFQGVSWDSKSFQAPPYYGLRFTQFFESYPLWGIAFDFTHYKIYARTGDVVAFRGSLEWGARRRDGAARRARAALQHLARRELCRPARSLPHRVY
jgi:hypothetical protein